MRFSFVCRCHTAFLWRYVSCSLFLLCFVFVIFAFIDSAALRSINLRYVGAPIVSLRMLLFPSIMHHYRFSICKGGSYGNKILYKNLDLTQDFPNKMSFHFLWVKKLPKNLPTIFRWPEMCPLGKILAQDFQMAAFTKILERQDMSIAPLVSTGNRKIL